jgi:ectoine hydroxylase-related dioxygenase (phytanoyl-CoA dioxygenase family)
MCDILRMRLPCQFPAAKISAQQIQDFSRNGFLVLDEFLDVQYVRAIIRQIKSLETDSVSSRIRCGAAFARRNMLELEFVHALASHVRVRELIDAITPGLIGVRAILFDKNESANWTVPWHQDRSIAVRERIDLSGFGPWSTKAGVIHVQPPREILKQMLTLRIHLDPCGPDNGPLRVIPGTQNRILDQMEVERCISEIEQTACVTGAGGLLLMRPLLLHASSSATKPSHRRVIHIEFGPSKLPGGLRWGVARGR